MTINDNLLFDDSYLSDVKISASLSGIGTSGVSVKCLQFSIPYSQYVSSGVKPTLVSLSFTATSGATPFLFDNFYVDSRSFSDGKVTYTCYDILATADTIQFTSSDFSATGTTYQSLIGQCMSKLGITGTAPTIDDGGVSVPCDKFVGCTVASVLQEISEYAMGVFFLSHTGSLLFSRALASSTTLSISDHTTVQRSSNQKISKIVATVENNDVISVGSTGGMVVNITNDYVTSSHLTTLYNAVSSTNYYPTTVSKVKFNTSTLPQLKQTVTCGDSSTFVIGAYDFTLSKSGIYGSISANMYTQGEIGQWLSEQQRTINSCIKSGQKCNGSFMTAYQGMMFYPNDDE